jgi:radical SAM superfamily enzyme YgiQ (UPF0313 family)
MSSLGFQTVLRLLAGTAQTACERAFLPDDAVGQDPPITYESLSPLANFPVVAFSVAYELELAGVVQLLHASGIPPKRDARGKDAPLVLAGGPLTYSNPLPLSPFADAIVMGEAETVLPEVMATLHEVPAREQALQRLATLDHVYVPAHHDLAVPSLAVCDVADLPAHSIITTPHTELADMFLVEVTRGCSRGCAYCVMRRSPDRSLRIVPRELVVSTVPQRCRRVGLVGASVSDHPDIASIVHDLAFSGREVGLSSLRADRINDDLVAAMRLAGYRTLTTALDGTSVRLRARVDRRGQEQHFLTTAALARRYRMHRLKLYLMVGVPGEADEDIDECVRLVSELSRTLPVALGVAPFCAKRNTPLDRSPYAGVTVVRERLARLRRGLRGRATVRSTSARWAWVEHVLAQGGPSEGLAVAQAVYRGGRFSDYRRAFAALGHEPDG